MGRLPRPARVATTCRVERRAVPAHLVASEVNELIGKDLGELGEDRVDGAASVGVFDVEAGVVDAEARAGSPRVADITDTPIRVCGKPTRGMAGYVKLRHDADRAVGGVVHKVSQFGMRIGVGAGKFRVGVGAEPKALVVGEVQVKDVQLVERHHIECAFQGRERDEVPDRVDHHAAPGVVGRVVNLGGVEGPAGDELRQGRERRERAPFGLGPDRHRLAHRQLVLIRIGESRNGQRRAVDFELND